MKKRLLFVHPCMGFGGAEKSLQTLLGALDKTQYDADLFLFRQEGALLELLPPEVHLLPPQTTAETFSLPLQSACATFLKQGRPDLAVSRARFSKAVRGNAPMRTLEQRGWKYQRAAFSPLPKQYDAAIAYLEGSPIYFCADDSFLRRRGVHIFLFVHIRGCRGSSQLFRGQNLARDNINHNDSRRRYCRRIFQRPCFNNEICRRSIQSASLNHILVYGQFRFNQLFPPLRTDSDGIGYASHFPVTVETQCSVYGREGSRLARA